MPEKLRKDGKIFIHPFDDEEVIAGQGTIGLEILEEVPEVETIIVPIGGGGLISGISTIVKKKKPHVKIIGVESAHAPSAFASLKRRKIVEVKIKTHSGGWNCSPKDGGDPFPHHPKKSR